MTHYLNDVYFHGQNGIELESGPINSQTIAQNGEIQLSKNYLKEKHSIFMHKTRLNLNLVHLKATNDCTTWFNIHAQNKIELEFGIFQKLQTFAQHGEIQKQLHNMVKFKNN